MWVLNQHVEFYFVNDDGGEYKPLPTSYANTWLNNVSQRKRLPSIELFSHNPIYTEDWRLVRPGFDPQSGFYYAGPQIEPVEGTKHLDALLRDFCWKKPADRTNYIGILLTGLLVSRFIGSKPAALFNGNQPELGKSVLAQILAILRDGQHVETASVPIANDACAACLQQTRPRTKNSVTCSKAIEYLSIVQMPIPQDLLECVKPPTQGVGTELETLIAKTRKFLSWFCLAWIIPTGFTCGCHSTKRRMNELGPRLCMRDGDELSAEVLKHWILHVPMIRFIPFVLTIIGLYVLRAANNAESKEKLHG